jgi:hypothetical protein
MAVAGYTCQCTTSLPHVTQGASGSPTCLSWCQQVAMQQAILPARLRRQTGHRLQQVGSTQRLLPTWPMSIHPWHHAQGRIAWTTKLLCLTYRPWLGASGPASAWCCSSGTLPSATHSYLLTLTHTQCGQTPGPQRKEPFKQHCCMHALKPWELG